MFGTQGKLLIRYGTADSVPPGFKPEQFIRCLGHHGANGYGMYVKEAKEDISSEEKKTNISKLSREKAH